MSDTRLIEVAFPLKQASLESVHEKNVRHGHISTLHIWPARRPLAASRAALIATLLPDPGNAEERREILERLAGKVVQKTKKVKGVNGRIEERTVEETVGGILHWGRESGPDLDWFRQKIREAYGGRAPRVLDPFAGGGAIPLEAMRLGCDVTAVDINPVAWFILKCTLEYPQKLAGQKRPLPAFALEDKEFMAQFRKAHGLSQKKPKGRGRTKLKEQPATYEVTDQHSLFETAVPYGDEVPEADLAWHVRAWGRWVLQRARADLERFYPTIDGKPTVAYLWARTVRCKNCRATIPLLKTRWLCKKENKRVVLTMEPNAERTGVAFGIQNDVPKMGGNAAQRREHDKKLGQGTMSSKGVWCPCCGKPGTVAMTSEDLRQEAQAGRMGAMMTAVVVDDRECKEYRLPTIEESGLDAQAEQEIVRVFEGIPFGLPDEPVPQGGSRSGGGSSFTVHLYGLTKWSNLFRYRQLLALGVFVDLTRDTRETMRSLEYSEDWIEGINAFLAVILDRAANYLSTVCIWEPVAGEIKQTFLRFALPITWDFAEANPLVQNDRFYNGAIQNAAKALDNLLQAATNAQTPKAINRSAIVDHEEQYDLILTDPPYYDAISYSDLMDFFYVWLRRTLCGLSEDLDIAFRNSNSPKWDHESNDGELIDEPCRFDDDKGKSKRAYEDGMYRSFMASWKALYSNGRMCVVFAHKHPDAWEALVSAIVRAGFVVDGSWPIMTEMRGGVRNLRRASLSSSVWLVCKKRPETARPGWDNRVLDEMREKIALRLRDFWDAGIRGPDFVWAATGPALEAYSKHPVVKKANEPGELMGVGEFLRQVRRIVVDFVVGRVLGGEGAEASSGLDDVTTYYLLHRNDFGMGDAPAGACILYAVSCGLSDSALADQWDLLARSGGKAVDEDDDEDSEASEEGSDDVEELEGSGSSVRLKSWQQRKNKNLGLEAPGGRPVPLIDQVHRLMQLWKAGEVVKVDDYLDARALRRNQLFHQLLQALIELASAGSDERALLESISNHVVAKGAVPQLRMFDDLADGS
jgi:adenine-specific DNA methylase